MIRPGTVDYHKVCQEFDPKKAKFQKLGKFNTDSRNLNSLTINYLKTN